MIPGTPRVAKPVTCEMCNDTGVVGGYLDSEACPDCLKRIYGACRSCHGDGRCHGPCGDCHGVCHFCFGRGASR